MKLTLLSVFLFCVAVNADGHGCPVDLECPVEDDARINMSPDSIICAQDLCDVINNPSVLFIDVRPCNMIGDTPPINGVNWMNLPMGEIDFALNMTDSDFQQKYHHAMPQQDERIVVYCQTSLAASQALEILRFRGFTNAVHFPGSSSRWQCLKQDQTFCPEEINDRQLSDTCEIINNDHGCPFNLGCPVNDDPRINLSPDSIICAQDLCDVINDPSVLFIDVRSCDMLSNTPPINAVNWMNLPRGEMDAALNMSDSEFQQRYHHAMPQQDERIVLYCQTSVASSRALALLRQRGFTNAVHFPGAASRWECLKQDPNFCPEEINDRQLSDTCEIISNDHDDQEMAHFDCEQYYGHDDRCHQIKAYFCDQASWRINFFTQWMHDFLQFRSQHGLPELDMPECQDHQVECRNEGMQMCHTAVNGCEICYCADHEYENMQQLDGMWRRDYQRWSHVQQEWRQMWQNSQQASNNNNNNEGDC